MIAIAPVPTSQSSEASPGPRGAVLAERRPSVSGHGIGMVPVPSRRSGGNRRDDLSNAQTVAARRLPAARGTGRTYFVNSGRPEPLYAQIEEVLIDEEQMWSRCGEPHSTTR